MISQIVKGSVIFFAHAVLLTGASPVNSIEVTNTATAAASSTAAAAASSTAAASETGTGGDEAAKIPLYGQCGGYDNQAHAQWSKSTKCAEGTCQKQNDYYSQ
eukprot:Pgem_evm1s5684